MVFPKKSHWNMIFLALSKKMIFLFPGNIILFFRRKMEDDLSQKKYMEPWNFLQIPKKRRSFQKKLHWNMIFLVLSEKMVFFPKKHDIFSFDGKWKMIFFKKYMEVWYFLCICKMSHSGKSSNDSLKFYGDLHRCFHILLSSEKKPGNSIYRI